MRIIYICKDCVLSEYSFIIIEGSQGVGKTTVANYSSENLDATLQRGISIGESLMRNSEPQNWQESIAVLVRIQTNGTPVFDRSTVSLIAYNMCSS